MLPQAGDLVGDYGDIFWDLPPRLDYFAGEEINCNIYVANTTDKDRTYMLRMRVTQNGTIVSETTLRVGSGAWFDLASWKYALLPGSMVSPVSNAVLVVELVDSETSEATDSVYITLTSYGVTELPIWGGVATSGMMDIFSLMILMMIMGMMTGMMKPKKKEGEK